MNLAKDDLQIFSLSTRSNIIGIERAVVQLNIALKEILPEQFYDTDGLLPYKLKTRTKSESSAFCVDK